MVEADLVDEHAAGLDFEQVREEPLQPDRDVAEPYGSVAGVQEATHDDSDRVREVDDPGVVRRELSDALGDLEDDRDRAERLSKTARPGRLLADTAACERDRLVL